MISAGLVLSGFGMLMTGFAQGFLMVALWRGLTGVGSGSSNVPVMGLLSSWFSKQKRGYTRKSAGNLFMLIGWLSLFCGVIWGSVSNRLGRKYTLAIVYVLQSAAFGLFALWTEPPGFLLSTVLFGLTAWSIPAIMAAVCGDVFGAQLAPAALGFITLFFGIGQAVGPSVAGAIADATGTFDPAFLLAGIVALLGAAGSLFLKA